MLPLLALVVVEMTLAETCAACVAVVGALKLCLDTVEVAQRVKRAAKETPK